MTILHPKQAEIVQSKKRFRVVITGRRFGKTIVSVNELIGKAFFTEDAIVAYVAPTNEDVRDIVWRELRNATESIATKVNDVRMEIEITNKFGGISVIKTASWESIINKGRLRGQKFHFIVMDEVSSYKNFWVGWEEVIRPTLTDYKGDVLFIGTPKGLNHFYDLYNQKDRDEDFDGFKYTTYDNPHIDPTEIDKAKKQMTPDRFQQEYMGEFRKMEGLVYKEFIREIDVKPFEEKDINLKEIIVGIDWGYTNPAGGLRILVDKDNKFYINQEYYKRGKTTDEIIETIKHWGGVKYYPDPAEPDRIEESRRQGLNIREVSKDKVAGIDKVRELFKQRRIIIHPSCVNLINELETYHYPEVKSGNEKEEPVKENDHLMDALRYALYNYQGSTPINLNFTETNKRFI
jgi:PBSX family phage terminase large subunit